MAKQIKKIYVTENDKKRLLELIKAFRTTISKDISNLLQLQQELDRAEIVEPEKVPKTAVTMNSKIRLVNLDDNSEMIFQVVYPCDSDAEEGKISIFAPIGTAVLGYKVGDIVEWQVPAGMRRFRIEELLYQPEAAGVFS